MPVKTSKSGNKIKDTKCKCLCNLEDRIAWQLLHKKKLSSQKCNKETATKLSIKCRYDLIWKPRPVKADARKNFASP